MLVFLDIDGVLNGHDFDVGAQSTRIQYRCIRQLNRIIRATQCKFVLSSAWRYMILNGSMTTLGFEYLMRTHGACGFRLLGTTCSDEDAGWTLDTQLMVRGKQVSKWLFENKYRTKPYVVIDDDDLGISLPGHPLVLTNGEWGLSKRNADAAIKILKGKP